MPCCCVPYCRNRTETPGISLHRFPANERAAKAWLKAIRRQDYKPNCNSRICSWHFPDGKTKGPTKFAWTQNPNFDFSVPGKKHVKTRKKKTSGRETVPEESKTLYALADVATKELLMSKCKQSIKKEKKELDKPKENTVNIDMTQPFYVVTKRAATTEKETLTKKKSSKDVVSLLVKMKKT